MQRSIAEGPDRAPSTDHAAGSPTIVIVGLLIALGAEGKGLRQRTRDCCDIVARLDLPGAVKSLNVSNAAAVALYEAARAQRG